MTLFGALAIYYQLPFLLVVISLVYSATRYEEWGAILLEAVRWGGRMLGFMAAIAAVLFVVSLLI